MSPEDNVFEYPAPVWQRFGAPLHAGRLADGEGVFSAQAGSPAARSLLRLQVQVQDRQIAVARFQAYGCPVAIAVGEWLAAALEAQPLAGLQAPSAAEVRTALEIGDDKSHCALMGEDVVKALLQQMKSDFL